MIQSITQIGNSKGIRIPKYLLQDLHIEDKVTLEVVETPDHQKVLQIMPLPTTTNYNRKNWKKAFDLASPEDSVFDDGLTSYWEKDEWHW